MHGSQTLGWQLSASAHARIFNHSASASFQPLKAKTACQSVAVQQGLSQSSLSACILLQMLQLHAAVGFMRLLVFPPQQLAPPWTWLANAERF